MDWTALSLPKRPYTDNIPVPPQEGNLPEGQLPMWHRLAMNAKLPYPWCPPNTVTFVKPLVGESVIRSYPSKQFEYKDIYNRFPSGNYDCLNDPYLRDYFRTTDGYWKLLNRGFITKEGKVKCTLEEFNQYRMYLHKVYALEVSQLRRLQQLAEKQRLKGKLPSHPIHQFSSEERHELETHLLNRDLRQTPKVGGTKEVISNEELRSLTEKEEIFPGDAENDSWIAYQRRLRDDYKERYSMIRNWLNKDTNYLRNIARKELATREKREAKRLKRFRRLCEHGWELVDKEYKIRKAQDEERRANIERRLREYQKQWEIDSHKLVESKRTRRAMLGKTLSDVKTTSGSERINDEWKSRSDERLKSSWDLESSVKSITDFHGSDSTEDRKSKEGQLCESDESSGKDTKKKPKDKKKRIRFAKDLIYDSDDQASKKIRTDDFMSSTSIEIPGLSWSSSDSWVTLESLPKLKDLSALVQSVVSTGKEESSRDQNPEAEIITDKTSMTPISDFHQGAPLHSTMLTRVADDLGSSDEGASDAASEDTDLMSTAELDRFEQSVSSIQNILRSDVSAEELREKIEENLSEWRRTSTEENKEPKISQTPSEEQQKVRSSSTSPDFDKLIDEISEVQHSLTDEYKIRDHIEPVVEESPESFKVERIVEDVVPDSEVARDRSVPPLDIQEVLTRRGEEEFDSESEEEKIISDVDGKSDISFVTSFTTENELGNVDGKSDISFVASGTTENELESVSQAKFVQYLPLPAPDIQQIVSESEEDSKIDSDADDANPLANIETESEVVSRDHSEISEIEKENAVSERDEEESVSAAVSDFSSTMSLSSHDILSPHIEQILSESEEESKVVPDPDDKDWLMDKEPESRVMSRDYAAVAETERENAISERDEEERLSSVISYISSTMSLHSHEILPDRIQQTESERHEESKTTEDLNDKDLPVNTETESGAVQKDYAKTAETETEDVTSEKYEEKSISTDVSSFNSTASLPSHGTPSDLSSMLVAESNLDIIPKEEAYDQVKSPEPDTQPVLPKKDKEQFVLKAEDDSTIRDTDDEETDSEYGMMSSDYEAVATMDVDNANLERDLVSVSEEVLDAGSTSLSFLDSLPNLNSQLITEKKLDTGSQFAEVELESEEKKILRSTSRKEREDTEGSYSVTFLALERKYDDIGSSVALSSHDIRIPSPVDDNQNIISSGLSDLKSKEGKVSERDIDTCLPESYESFETGEKSNEEEAGSESAEDIACTARFEHRDELPENRSQTSESARSVESEKTLFAEETESDKTLFAEEAESEKTLSAEKAESDKKLFAEEAESKRTLSSEEAESDKTMFAEEAESNKTLFAKEVESDKSLFAEEAESDKTLSGEEAESDKTLSAEKAESDKKLFAEEAESERTLSAEEAEIDKTLFAEEAESDKTLFAKEVESDKSLFAEEAESDKTLSGEEAESDKTLSAEKAESDKKLFAEEAESERTLSAEEAESDKTLFAEKAESDKTLFAEETESDKTLFAEETESDKALFAEETESERTLSSEEAESDKTLPAEEAENDKTLFAKEAESDKTLFAKEAESDKTLFAEEAESDKTLSAEEAESDKTLSAEEAESDKTLFAEEAESDKTLFAKEAESDKSLFAEEAESDKTLSAEEAESDKTLSAEEAESDKTLSAEEAESDRTLFAEEAESDRTLFSEEAESDKALYAEEAESYKTLFAEEAESDREAKLENTCPETTQEFISPETEEHEPSDKNFIYQETHSHSSVPSYKELNLTKEEVAGNTFEVDLPVHLTVYDKEQDIGDRYEEDSTTPSFYADIRGSETFLDCLTFISRVPLYKELSHLSKHLVEEFELETVLPFHLRLLTQEKDETTGVPVEDYEMKEDFKITELEMNQYEEEPDVDMISESGLSADEFLGFAQTDDEAMSSVTSLCVETSSPIREEDMGSDSEDYMLLDEMSLASPTPSYKESSDQPSSSLSRCNTETNFPEHMLSLQDVHEDSEDMKNKVGFCETKEDVSSEEMLHGTTKHFLKDTSVFETEHGLKKYSKGKTAAQECLVDVSFLYASQNYSELSEFSRKIVQENAIGVKLPTYVIESAILEKDEKDIDDTDQYSTRETFSFMSSDSGKREVARDSYVWFQLVGNIDKEKSTSEKSALANGKKPLVSGASSSSFTSDASLKEATERLEILRKTFDEIEKRQETLDEESGSDEKSQSDREYRKRRDQLKTLIKFHTSELANLFKESAQFVSEHSGESDGGQRSGREPVSGASTASLQDAEQGIRDALDRYIFEIVGECHEAEAKKEFSEYLEAYKDELVQLRSKVSTPPADYDKEKSEYLESSSSVNSEDLESAHASLPESVVTGTTSFDESHEEIGVDDQNDLVRDSISAFLQKQTSGEERPLKKPSGAEQKENAAKKYNELKKMYEEFAQKQVRSLLTSVKYFMDEGAELVSCSIKEGRNSSLDETDQSDVEGGSKESIISQEGHRNQEFLEYLASKYRSNVLDLDSLDLQSRFYDREKLKKLQTESEEGYSDQRISQEETSDDEVIHKECVARKYMSEDPSVHPLGGGIQGTRELNFVPTKADEDDYSSFEPPEKDLEKDDTWVESLIKRRVLKDQDIYAKEREIIKRRLKKQTYDKGFVVEEEAHYKSERSEDIVEIEKSPVPTLGTFNKEQWLDLVDGDQRDDPDRRSGYNILKLYVKEAIVQQQKCLRDMIYASEMEIPDQKVLETRSIKAEIQEPTQQFPPFLNQEKTLSGTVLQRAPMMSEKGIVSTNLNFIYSNLKYDEECFGKLKTIMISESEVLKKLTRHIQENSTLAQDECLRSLEILEVGEEKKESFVFRKPEAKLLNSTDGTEMEPLRFLPILPPYPNLYKFLYEKLQEPVNGENIFFVYSEPQYKSTTDDDVDRSQAYPRNKDFEETPKRARKVPGRDITVLDDIGLAENVASQRMSEEKDVKETIPSIQKEKYIEREEKTEIRDLCKLSFTYSKPKYDDGMLKAVMTSESETLAKLIREIKETSMVTEGEYPKTSKILTIGEGKREILPMEEQAIEEVPELELLKGKDVIQSKRKEYSYSLPRHASLKKPPCEVVESTVGRENMIFLYAEPQYGSISENVAKLLSHPGHTELEAKLLNTQLTSDKDVEDVAEIKLTESFVTQEGFEEVKKIVGETQKGILLKEEEKKLATSVWAVSSLDTKRETRSLCELSFIYSNPKYDEGTFVNLKDVITSDSKVLEKLIRDIKANFGGAKCKCVKPSKILSPDEAQKELFIAEGWATEDKAEVDPLKWLSVSRIETRDYSQPRVSLTYLSEVNQETIRGKSSEVNQETIRGKPSEVNQETIKGDLSEVSQETIRGENICFIYPEIQHENIRESITKLLPCHEQLGKILQQTHMMPDKDSTHLEHRVLEKIVIQTLTKRFLTEHEQKLPMLVRDSHIHDTEIGTAALSELSFIYSTPNYDKESFVKLKTIMTSESEILATLTHDIHTHYERERERRFESWNETVTEGKKKLIFTEEGIAEDKSEAELSRGENLVGEQGMEDLKTSEHTALICIDTPGRFLISKDIPYQSGYPASQTKAHTWSELSFIDPASMHPFLKQQDQRHAAFDLILESLSLPGKEYQEKPVAEPIVPKTLAGNVFKVCGLIVGHPAHQMEGYSRNELSFIYSAPVYPSFDFERMEGVMPYDSATFKETCRCLLSEGSAVKGEIFERLKAADELPSQEIEMFPAYHDFVERRQTQSKYPSPDHEMDAANLCFTYSNPTYPKDDFNKLRSIMIYDSEAYQACFEQFEIREFIAERGIPLEDKKLRFYLEERKLSPEVKSKSSLSSVLGSSMEKYEDVASSEYSSSFSVDTKSFEELSFSSWSPTFQKYLGETHPVTDKTLAGVPYVQTEQLKDVELVGEDSSTGTTEGDELCVTYSEPEYDKLLPKEDAGVMIDLGENVIENIIGDLHKGTRDDEISFSEPSKLEKIPDDERTLLLSTQKGIFVARKEQTSLEKAVRQEQEERLNYEERDTFSPLWEKVKYLGAKTIPLTKKTSQEVSQRAIYEASKLDVIRNLGFMYSIPTYEDVYVKDSNSAIVFNSEIFRNFLTKLLEGTFFTARIEMRDPILSLQKQSTGSLTLPVWPQQKYQHAVGMKTYTFQPSVEEVNSDDLCFAHSTPVLMDSYAERTKDVIALQRHLPTECEPEKGKIFDRQRWLLEGEEGDILLARDQMPTGLGVSIESQDRAPIVSDKREILRFEDKKKISGKGEVRKLYGSGREEDVTTAVSGERKHDEEATERADFLPWKRDMWKKDKSTIGVGVPPVMAGSLELSKEARGTEIEFIYSIPKLRTEEMDKMKPIMVSNSTTITDLILRLMTAPQTSPQSPEESFLPVKLYNVKERKVCKCEKRVAAIATYPVKGRESPPPEIKSILDAMPYRARTEMERPKSTPEVSPRYGEEILRLSEPIGFVSKLRKEIASSPVLLTSWETEQRRYAPHLALSVETGIRSEVDLSFIYSSPVFSITPDERLEKIMQFDQDKFQIIISDIKGSHPVGGRPLRETEGILDALSKPLSARTAMVRPQSTPHVTPTHRDEWLRFSEPISFAPKDRKEIASLVPTCEPGVEAGFRLDKATPKIETSHYEDRDGEETVSAFRYENEGMLSMAKVKQDSLDGGSSLFIERLVKEKYLFSAEPKHVQEPEVVPERAQTFKQEEEGLLTVTSVSLDAAGESTLSVDSLVKEEDLLPEELHDSNDVSKFRCETEGLAQVESARADELGEGTLLLESLVQESVLLSEDPEIEKNTCEKEKRKEL